MYIFTCQKHNGMEMCACLNTSSFCMREKYIYIYIILLNYSSFGIKQPTATSQTDIPTHIQ